jgi:acyl-CoA reductase-like NAD-dependent aldehyde dehydrogenase
VTRDEIFGPVLAVIAFDAETGPSPSPADTCYLTWLLLWTASINCAHRMCGDPRRHRLGQLLLEGDISTPFGGYKQSGFGGRDRSIARSVLRAEDHLDSAVTIDILLACYFQLVSSTSEAPDTALPLSP